MTEPADQQSEPAYCAYTTERHGITYRCTKEVHKGGHNLQKLEDIADPLRVYFDTTTATDLEDRDDTAELVATNTAHDAASVEMMQRTARLVERKRHASLLSYEVGMGTDIVDDIMALDEDRWSDNLTADEESLRRIKKRVDAWLLQVGIREDGGS